jgi:hypothetical protein
MSRLGLSKLSPYPPWLLVTGSLYLVGALGGAVGAAAFASDEAVAASVFSQVTAHGQTG